MKKFIKNKNIILTSVFVLILIIATSYYISRQAIQKHISLNEFRHLESLLSSEEKTNQQNAQIECKESDKPINVITKLMDFLSATLKIYFMIVSSDISKCIKDSYDKISYRCLKKNHVFYGDISKVEQKIEKIYMKLAFEGIEMKSVISGGEGNFSQANLFIKNFKTSMETNIFGGSPYNLILELGGYLNMKKIDENFIIKYKGRFTNLLGDIYSIDFQRFSYFFSTSEGSVSGTIEGSGCLKMNNICECFKTESDKLEINIAGIFGRDTLCDAEGEINLNGQKLILSGGKIKIGEESFFCDEAYY